MNRIIIKGLKIFGNHGVHDFEKINGQNFYVDTIVDTTKLEGYESDKLKETISYSDIIKVIKKTFTEKSYNLIERVAEKISENIFNNFKEVLSLEVTVKKPQAPIKEDVEYVAVKIKRTRKEEKSDKSYFIFGK